CSRAPSSYSFGYDFW
nr:immunoglobulin heavy chain junction region [Macaca mulatta]MOV42572.1 immunoglobulin heavy chain junction region [Macaca mulatta]MOV42958.1 immunoglobulin heavy chain junction region [Macaca mulatta]MOV45463.1 immunoglobulin heavy chain junction region [Macaca mulatta]MOV46236.1 immunoglobulin heavy chain junction region [Macaca mulatta]